MSHGFNLIHELVGKEYQTLAVGGLSAASLIGMAFVADRSLRSDKTPLVPTAKLGVRAFFELIVRFFGFLGDDVMGKENRKYLPFITSLFLFIFVSNFMGLIPGIGTPSVSVAWNFGIAALVFVLYHFWGIREVGAWYYFKHMLGPFGLWIGIFIFSIEVMSHTIRMFTLSLRLFGNIFADETVLAVVVGLSKIGVPVVFYFYGLFVSFMQALVFSALTMFYISMAVTHEDDNDDSH